MPALVPVHLKAQAGASRPHVTNASRNLRDAAAALTAYGAAQGARWIPTAAALALVGIVGERALAPTLDWLGNDPENPWYAVEVRLKRSHLHAEPIPVEDSQTEDAVACFEAINYGSAALRAYLRATERQGGAMEARAISTAEEQGRQRKRFATESAAGLNEIADSYEAIAVDLKTLRLGRPTTPATDAARARQHVLQILQAVGLDESTAENELGSDSPEGLSHAGETVNEASLSIRKLADEMKREAAGLAE